MLSLSRIETHWGPYSLIRMGMGRAGKEPRRLGDPTSRARLSSIVLRDRKCGSARARSGSRAEPERARTGSGASSFFIALVSRFWISWSSASSCGVGLMAFLFWFRASRRSASSLGWCPREWARCQSLSTSSAAWWSFSLSKWVHRRWSVNVGHLFLFLRVSKTRHVYLHL